MADPLQEMAAREMQARQQASGGKPGFIITPFGPIALEVNVGGGLSATSCSPFAKNVPALFGGTGKQGGLGDKFLQACMRANDELSQMNRSNPIVYGGDIQHAGGSMQGGGFVSTAPGRGDDFGVA